jgi:hypothetical protein
MILCDKCSEKIAVSQPTLEELIFVLCEECQTKLAKTVKKSSTHRAKEREDLIHQVLARKGMCREKVNPYLYCERPEGHEGKHDAPSLRGEGISGI